MELGACPDEGLWPEASIIPVLSELGSSTIGHHMCRFDCRGRGGICIDGSQKQGKVVEKKMVEEKVVEEKVVE